MKLYILISLVLLSMTMVSSQEIQISQSNNVIDRIVNMDLPTAKDFNNNTDNVNSSNYWNNLNTTNTTQFENNGGVLNILNSWLTTFFDLLFSGKTTDDLTEGTTNFYDNRSWNQTLADTLYSSIIWGYNQSQAVYDNPDASWLSTFNATYDTLESGNASFNQTLTDSLYLPHTVIWDALFNSTGDNRWLDANNSFNQSFTDTLYSTGAHTVDTQKTTNNFYLYNDTTTIFFNETQLNNTIDARDSDTIYTNGSGISLVGTEFNHTDTSSQVSSDNSGNTFIQDVILDTFGHITSIVTSIVEITNIFDQSLNTTDDVVFNSVNATNWGNVSITESQISDLAHTSAGNLSWNQSLADGLYSNFTSTNVSFLNNTQTFTGSNTFLGSVNASNGLSLLYARYEDIINISDNLGNNITSTSSKVVASQGFQADNFFAGGGEQGKTQIVATTTQSQELTFIDGLYIEAAY